MRGGHLNTTHIDAGALEFLRERFGVRTMVDIGCGPGGMQAVAREQGVAWTGIDADDAAADVPGAIQWCFETQGRPPFPCEWDLAWSVEFLEHVGQASIQSYMPVFAGCRVAMVTHSEKPGRWHVTLRNDDFWDGVFAGYGFRRNLAATSELKRRSTMRREFVQTNGRVYVREEA